ncbi:probable inactive ATP-dependent zinc metalloprotease FTSHI 3, chloroplastic [Selaginella moellendorffii]|uniref:probable inactive ATP-dependent zinc metalloprotease FTSHI 3, chloroplastic n=1 Tax=Selaginella moellendorffii TaxID=88036 RepID=UPI000D1CBE65|nr:probable inactive ATP-dependent zinc metalloprotease FTSHI 3, chloroplastic [Selaginella moellendorffii]|eukprot:XP_024533655.1 probable inactive ATP-dependent zinc metalloprotease FTSHI 3, chloroplastic [Selaginella moellendorffii]
MNAACYGFHKVSTTGTLFTTSSSDSFHRARLWPRGSRASGGGDDKRCRLSLRCSSYQSEHNFGRRPLAVIGRNSSSSNSNDGKREIQATRKPWLRVLRVRMRLWRRSVKIFLWFSAARFSRALRKNWRGILGGGFVACLFTAGSFLVQLSAATAPTSVSYSTLIQSLEAQRVQSVLFEEGSSQIFFNIVAEKVGSGEEEANSMATSSVKSASSSSGRGKGTGEKTWQFCTRKIRHDESYLLGLLRNGAGNVEYSSAPRSFSSVAASVIGTLLTLWIPLTPLMWLMHRQITGKADMSKKRRKNIQSVKFEDVAGVDTAKDELLEIVSCLRGALNFRSLGAKFPKGVLLIGPPGTGKTLLARALAGEAGVPFFAASASEFVEMFVGRGAARIRELFTVARKHAPSVIFIDELDAVGGQRGRGFNDERDQTLNQLLTEMDGFESGTGVLVLAATNRADALDPALCRAGRFSRKVFVREPDLDGRRQVLAVHMRGVRVEGDPEELQRFVASITPGFVGADLANVVNEAALLAARRGQSAVNLDNFREAVDRSKYGIGQEPNFLSDFERKVCALVQSVRGGKEERYVQSNTM